MKGGNDLGCWCGGLSAEERRSDVTAENSKYWNMTKIH
jgi:hypothetical protein